MAPRRLLLDDAALLALDKPPGVSMATSSRPGKSEEEVVSRLLAACGVEAEPRPRLVHRLDEGTSGVVLLARGADAHRALTRAFQERAARKTYRALAWGHPVPAHGVADAPLGRDPRDGRRMVVRADGKPAVTRWATLRRYPSVADLELAPETGRTHQIRVHLAAGGMPVLGDTLYGGRPHAAGLALRAVGLSYRDPFARRQVAIRAPEDEFLERYGFPPLG